jgi:hypothetical protein
MDEPNKSIALRKPWVRVPPGPPCYPHMWGVIYLLLRLLGGLRLGIMIVDVILVQSGITKFNHHVLFMTEKSLLIFHLVLSHML